MGDLEVIYKLLDKLPFWKRIVPLPDKVAELEKRVSEVERLLNGNAPPDFCELCGERAARMGDRRLITDNKPPIVREDWFCQSCKKYSVRYSGAK